MKNGYQVEHLDLMQIKLKLPFMKFGMNIDETLDLIIATYSQSSIL